MICLVQQDELQGEIRLVDDLVGMLKMQIFEISLNHSLDEDLTEDDKEQEKQNLEVKTWNTISMLISKQVFMVENKQSNSIKNKHVEHVTENEEVIKKHVASVMATEELLRQAKVFLVQFNKQ